MFDVLFMITIKEQTFKNSSLVELFALFVLSPKLLKLVIFKVCMVQGQIFKVNL